MIASGHTLICGFGSLGSSTARARRRAGGRAGDLWVIEADHDRCEAARKLGYRTVLGNASDLSRLRVAHAGAAAEVIVCVSDDQALVVVRSVRQVAPSARMKVALRTDDQKEVVLSAGASEVFVLAHIAGAMLARSVIG